MDLTNRIFVMGIALLWMFVILVVILLAWGAPDESINRISDLAGFLEDHNTNATKLIITFGGLILVLLGALVILTEAMPPDSGSLKVTRVGSGEGRIGTDEITVRLEEEIRALPQIAQVEALVKGRGSKAEVSLDLHVRPEADLAATTEEACRVARHLIEERMGVELARPPAAQLHYRELRVGQHEAPTPQQATETAASPPEVENSHDSQEQPAEDRPAGT